MKRVNRFRQASVFFVCWTACWSPTKATQEATVAIDWHAELAKAKAAIETNPKSAFWHNQAGVAYDALGEFENAVKEIKWACTLDASNPNHYYTLYAFYKRKGTHS